MATSQFRKDYKAAPKFILQGYKDGVIFYVADSKKCKHAGTVNMEHAVEFSLGYDDENMKRKAWSICFGVQMNVIKLVSNA